MRGIAPPIAAIDDAARCLTPERASVAIGSLLHARPELQRDWLRWLREAPHGRASWLRQIDGVCESGLEMLWWFRMRGRLLGIRRQVHIPGVGRVDFLVGDRLIVEVDGAEYHTDPASFERDRQRDAVEAAVLAAVVRGDAR